MYQRLQPLMQKNYAAFFDWHNFFAYFEELAICIIFFVEEVFVQHLSELS